MQTKVYTVSGMTCGHCTGKVEKFVAKIEGVIEVKAELESGLVSVSGDFDETQVIATIEKLGYQLVN